MGTAINQKQYFGINAGAPFDSFSLPFTGG
jgi:hypothetical protein